MTLSSFRLVYPHLCVYSQTDSKMLTWDSPRVQLHGNNASYAFLLRVCALAYEALLPEPGTGCRTDD
jgi:hypothetical protein